MCATCALSNPFMYCFGAYHSQSQLFSTSIKKVVVKNRPSTRHQRQNDSRNRYEDGEIKREGGGYTSPFQKPSNAIKRGVATTLNSLIQHNK